MNIPHLTKDLAVIQKLSDLPNTTDGLSAADLKAKFDEAALSIQNWINETFIPALQAENIPFAGSEQLAAENIQDAIELVFGQVRDAASGTIVNGSVTKAKLSEELLERVFGGRAWVCLDTPGAEDVPGSGFPIGQIWLKPGFTVENAAKNNWVPTACTVEAKEHAVTVTGSGIVAQVSIAQTFSGIGKKGDRVYVLFDIENKDPEITALTVSLSGEETDAAKGVCQTILQGGSVSMEFQAVWPSTSLAKGSFTIKNLAVVNIDQILRQTADGREMADWIGYLRGLLPFDSHYDPRAMYIQTDTGIWQQFDREEFPIGTGELLYGNGGLVPERLAAGAENSLLQFMGGKPKWSTADEVAASTAIARTAENTYIGTGVAGTVELPGKPAVLWLRVDDQVHQFFQGTTMSETYDGKYTWENVVTGSEEAKKAYTAGVTLEGNLLNFWFTKPELQESQVWSSGDAVHFNEKDKQYTWTAIY